MQGMGPGIQESEFLLLEGEKFLIFKTRTDTQETSVPGVLISVPMPLGSAHFHTLLNTPPTQMQDSSFLEYIVLFYQLPTPTDSPIMVYSTTLSSVPRPKI
jgi:hypothetical protein